MGEQAKPTGPDFGAGVPLADLTDGQPTLGRVGDEAVVVVRSGDRVFAVGATCSHWSGPLAEGLVFGDGIIQCPWHHACFDLATGRAIGAPALNPIPCYEVRRRGAVIEVGAAQSPPANRSAGNGGPESVVIVGAGAAGAVAAEELRREGFGGSITLIGDDPSDPVDRPNLSKDYLAGLAQAEWIPLRDEAFYRDQSIELVRGAVVTEIDARGKRVKLADGRAIGFGALVLATGAEPIRLSIPGADLPHVHLLRSLGDSNALIEAAQHGPVAVIGASFIGLEVAAALRSRGLEVTVVAPDQIPLERVLGAEVGRFVQRVHESRGVRFRLGRKPVAIEASRVTLDDDSVLPAGLVVMGVGVKPRLGLAERAGLAVDRGVVVDQELRTSVPDIFAAGDIARFPYHGDRVRIEHWAVAERQGQAIARTLTGRGGPFRDVPFFWSSHYDTTISYLGHAERFDRVEIKGSLDGGSALIAYRDGSAIRAVATLNRDHPLLEAERLFERDDQAGLEALIARG